MPISLEFAPGLIVRGLTTPVSLASFKLLVLGLDSALLYPGAEELVDACKGAGMSVEMDLSEATSGAEKLKLLQAACEKLGLRPAQAVVVGRAESDLPILGVAGLPVAFMAQPAVASAADIVIQTGGMDRLLKVVTLGAKCAPKALDLAVLDVLVGHDPVKFRKFALLFVESVGAVLQEIDAAVPNNDLAVMVAMGHRAKSTARNIGAVEFADLCLALETAAKAKNLESALSIAAELRPSFDRICQAIDERLNASS